MSMSVGSSSEGEDAVMSEINTTPLVDVMLVLLIIFLITIPVITRAIKVDFPKAANIPTETKPENIVISIDKDGGVYWNELKVPGSDLLLERIKGVTMRASQEGKPQPEFHLRADKNVRYEHVGRTIVLAQRAGVAKVAFITEPDRGIRGTRR
ncbi:MAG TPA: biopolymer transporter ExbD [Steroidobacteraceae bacterium]|nr:biopolymer transporter ExbD [Steroidobacteraceae bacterium]